MANIGTLTANIGMNTAMLRADSARASRMLTSFSSSAAKGIGSVAASVVKLSAVFGGLALVIGGLKVFKDIVSIGEDFEQSMVTTAGVMRATTKETEQLTAAAQKMGETTEWSASQAASSLQFLGMAGFEADKAIAALPGTLDLATAGNLDLGRAADIATNALTAMGLPVEDLTRVNDVFIGTITRSNTNMEQMAEAFKYAAPLANAYGYSVEELSGLIGTLGNAGIQGSMAGTQLSQAMLEAKDIAQKFGFESGDLLDVITSLEKEFGDNVNMMDHFTKRAGKAALVLRAAGDSAQKFQETLGGVAGEAEALANKMRATFKGSKKELMSMVEALKIDMFGQIDASLGKFIRNMTAWLRENRKEILDWANTFVVGFGMVWDTVSEIWKIVSTVIGGITDVFSALETQSSETTNALVKDAEEIRGAFVPPDFTPWEEFLHTTSMWGKTLVQMLTFVAKGIVQLVTGVVNTLVSGLLKNVLEASFEFASAIERMMVLDLSGAWEHIQKTGKELKDIWVEGGAIGIATVDSWMVAFDNMVAGFDFRSLGELKIDIDWEQALAEAAAEADALKDGIDDFDKPLIHAPKDVALLTTNLEKASAAAGRLADAQVRLYSELLSSGNKTEAELTKLWEGYEAARIEQIKREALALSEMGVTVDLLSEVIAQRMEELSEQQRALFDEQGSWLHEWATDAAVEMQSSFSDAFFDVMKGEFTSLTDYFSSVWDVLLRKLADSAAAELSGIFMPGGGGLLDVAKLGKDKGGGVQSFQTGGLVSSPTLAMVGEVPEAIVPLTKLRDEGFLRGLGVGRSQTGGATYVTFHVSTPDPQSFKASQTQLMAQAAAALGAAGRRNA